MVEGWFSFLHGSRNPLLTRTQKLYDFEVTFRKVKLFTVISFDTTYGGRMAFFFFHGRRNPLLTRTQKWYGYEVTFREVIHGFKLSFKKVELYTVVSFAISYAGRMAFILLMGREPPCKREPES